MSDTGYSFASQVLLEVIGQSIRRHVGFLFIGGMIYNVQNLSSSLALIKFVEQKKSFLSLVMIFRLTCEVAYIVQGGSVLGWGVVQDKCKNLGVAATLLRTVRPHPLTLSPYVQMLARGITGALGWIRRPHRGRESRGGHGRGWPATQLPAQVSTGWHEQLFLPPPAHTRHAEGSPPPNSNPAVTEFVDKMTHV